MVEYAVFDVEVVCVADVIVWLLVTGVVIVCDVAVVGAKVVVYLSSSKG